MRAGRLDRTITLQRLTRSVNDAGTVADTWDDIGTVRAELLASAAVESVAGFGEAEETRLGFRIRYVADLTTEDRIIYAGVAFNLVEITEIGRRRGLELLCEKVR